MSSASYVLYASYITPLKQRRALCFLLLKRRAEMEKVVRSQQVLEPSPIVGRLFRYCAGARETSRWCPYLYSVSEVLHQQMVPWALHLYIVSGFSSTAYEVLETSLR